MTYMTHHDHARLCLSARHRTMIMIPLIPTTVPATWHKAIRVLRLNTTIALVDTAQVEVEDRKHP